MILSHGRSFTNDPQLCAVNIKTVYSTLQHISTVLKIPRRGEGIISVKDKKDKLESS